jgi:PleD family two-component response regulator
MIPQSDRLCTELVSTADTALYAAKHSGRNRVAISGNAAENEQRATA